MSSYLYPKVTTSRQLFNMNGLWKFKVDKKNEGRNKEWYLGLEDYRSIAVPSSYNDLFTEANIRDHLGDVWYQKDFYYHNNEQRHVLRFSSVTMRASVWLNGTYLGNHEGGYLPFEFDITPYLLENNENRLSVCVNNELSMNTIPVGTVETKWNGERFQRPSFDFFNYSGIHRPVTIYTTPSTYIENIRTKPDFKEGVGIIQYEVDVVGRSENVTINLYDEDNNLVGTNQGATGEVVVKNPRLWEPLDSYLYKLVVKVSDAETVDEYYLNVGLRTVKVIDNRFYINDKPFYFKGFGKHDDFDLIGKGLNLPVMIRDFELLKWIGANSVRTSHYPYPEEFYQLADEYGIVVIDEVPAVGMWKRSADLSVMGDKPFFEEDGVFTTLIDNHKNQLVEMVKRDVNHACVVMWSIANEPASDEDKAYDYFKEVFDFARTLDIQERPLVFVNCAIAPWNKCKVSPLSDILMLNRYSGWYDLFGAKFHMAKGDLKHRLENWSKSYNKPIIIAEYGADTLSGYHALPSTMFSEEYYVEFLEKYHEVFDQIPNVIGEHPWNFADFATEQDLKRVGGNKKGVFTRNRQPKMAAHVLRKRWLSLPNNYKGLQNPLGIKENKEGENEE